MLLVINNVFTDDNVDNVERTIKMSKMIKVTAQALYSHGKR